MTAPKPNPVAARVVETILASPGLPTSGIAKICRAIADHALAAAKGELK